MTDNDYAALIYRQVFHVESDGGDAYTRGILDAISTLDEREQITLEYYYRNGKPFGEIGKDIGVSGQTSRRIVFKALLKLRHPSRSRNMSVSVIVERLDNQLCVALDTVTGLCDAIERLIRGDPIDPKIRSMLDSQKMSVCKAGFSVRVNNHLLGAGISTVEALLELDTLDVLMARRNFGMKSRDEIISKMRELGYSEWADRVEK